MTPEDSISVLVANLVDDKRAAEERAVAAEADAIAAKEAYVKFYSKVQDYAVNHKITSTLAAIVVDDWRVFAGMFTYPDDDE